MQQKETVNQHWTSDLNQGYRQWLTAAQIFRQGTKKIHNALDTELMNKKIHFSDKKDILHWGYRPRGTFTTKEAYNILMSQHDGKDPIWEKICSLGIWLKISTFLWLLCHKRILTWDNLRKKSFNGPSRCPNCNQKEKII